METRTRINIKSTIAMFSVDFNHYKRVIRKEPFRRFEPVIQYSYLNHIGRIDANRNSFVFMFFSNNNLVYISYNESFKELYCELEGFIQKNRLRFITGSPIKHKRR